MKKAKLLMIAIPIVLTLLFGLGLALTIKYAYIDEIKHYHTAIYQINTCIIKFKTCYNVE